MGKCILHFDQIDIIKQKSAGSQADNDWLIVHWFVGQGGLKQAHTLPLKTTTGATNIHSGNSLMPLALEVSCQDADLVTVVFQIVNLNSYEGAEQVQKAGEIASKTAQALTEAYVEAAEFVVATFLPLGNVFAAGIDKLQPAIVDSVQTAFEDVIIPAVDEIVGFIAGLLGSPNCSGDVLHDQMLFPPSQPVADLAVAKVYTAASKTGCGGPAKTSVHLTLQRVRDFVPMFPSEQPPKLQTTPSGPDESPDNWLGTWAEDSFTPTPIITVSVSPSMAASGTYAINVVEHVDHRFNAEFSAIDNVEFPESVVVPLFLGNTFGTVSPWLAQPVKPFQLQAFVLNPLQTQQAKLAAPGREDEDTARVSPKTHFTLSWTRPHTTLFEAPGLVRRKPSDISHMLGYDTINAFVLEGKGVTLGLYSFRHNNVVVGRGLRYIRDENMLYTRADVMLVRWTPLG